MNKSLIVKIGGTVSALIFALGAFIPIASVEFFGTKMSMSMTDSTDWILVVLNALLAIAAFWLSEDISVDTCAAAAALIAYGKLNRFFDDSVEQASQFITKEGGFYCLIIGAVLLVVFGIGLWFIKDTPKKEKKKKELTRKCPFCAENIKSDALLCRFCGSKLEPVTTETGSEPEEDNSWKGIAKQGGRLVISIAMFVASVVLLTFVLVFVFGGISGNTENSGGNSNASAEYDNSDKDNPFDYFGNNQSKSEDSEPTAEQTTAATTAETTTSATTKATTTTTAAPQPEPEEITDSGIPFDISKLDQIYYMQQSGFDMFEPEIKAYIVIYSENNFIFGSSDYYKNTEYYGTWEYAGRS
ncbi:MAG: zinc ribbon domain-containing protein [Oscillospiraceae bacterium]